MKRSIPLLLSLLVLLTGCSSSQNITKQTITIEASTQDVYILGGKIQPDNSTSVASKINAKVTQLKVDVGTKVNEGDPIIYLDTKDLEAQLNQAEAAAATAQANLDKTTAGSRTEQIAAQQALVNGFKTAYDVAQKNYERQKELLKSGSTAQANVDQAEQVLSSAKAQYDSSVANLNTLQNGATQSDINAVAATVKQAQTVVEIARTSLSYGVITAPISGIVTAKNINEGEMSGVGQPLVTIISSNGLHVDSYAPEEVLPKLKAGLQVNVKVSEFPDKTFQGEISIINEQIDSRNKNTLVKIVLKDGNDVLKPGMFAEIGLKNKVGE